MLQCREISPLNTALVDPKNEKLFAQFAQISRHIESCGIYIEH